MKYLAVLFFTAAICLAGSSGNTLIPAPCALLSGEFPAATTLFHAASAASCSFKTGRGRVILLVRRLPDAEWAIEQVSRMQRGVSLGTYRELGTIGEHSFLLHAGTTAALCVFEGPYYVQVSAIGAANGTEKLDLLERLARQAVARLGTPM